MNANMNEHDDGKLKIMLEDMLEHGTVIPSNAKPPTASSFIKAANIWSKISTIAYGNQERVAVPDSILPDMKVQRVTF